MNRTLTGLLLAAACALAFSTPAPALVGNFKTLHVFKSGNDGGFIYSALVPDGQGSFYGTAQYGGAKHCDNEAGCGAVFRVASDGSIAILYAFRGGSDGAHPFAGVTVGPDGALYGTTVAGGGSINCGASGCGTYFA